MTVKTTTTMNMQHFHDFYVLQALQAAVNNELASNEELQFVKSIEKYQDDLYKTVDTLIPNMALRIFMYLYAACLGEARHASSTVAEKIYLDGSQRRLDWFANVSNFPPTDKNLKTLHDVFLQDWRAGYGGEAWANIAKALREYGSTPAAAWIDHVVDLEHNNGTAFSKPDGERTIYFDVYYPERFSNFLDYKFKCDILRDRPNFTSTLKVSPRVYTLVTRYTSLFKKPDVKFIVPELDNLGEYVVEWGDKTLEIGEKWCAWANVIRGNKPDIKFLLNEHGLFEFYPSQVTVDEFKNKIERAKKNVLKQLGEQLTPQLKAQLTKFTNDFFKRNFSKCKLPKAKTTYQIMPCKAHTNINKKIELWFNLPYQEGYGTKTNAGFYVETHCIPGKLETDTAYVERNYGDLILITKDNKYWISSSVLEALVD